MASARREAFDGRVVPGKDRRGDSRGDTSFQEEIRGRLVSDNRPIGVFDSGLGGLTVVKELLRLMPAESIVYLGDTARCPYGVRSDDAIRRFALQDARFLMAMDIKMLIVACNTVSSVALDHIRKDVSEIPVIGVVLPGCKAAVLRTAEKKVGVIGTPATIRTEAYARTIASIDKGIKVYGKACPLFVPLAEEGLADSEITRSAAQYYLYELVDTGMDCLILGCTHYPLLMETIQGVVGNSIEVLDSAFWTAKEAQDILGALNAAADGGRDGLGASTFHVTDMTPNFEKSARRFLGSGITRIEKIDLEDLCGEKQEASR
ncbi:MAG: glutamate racemase [Chitinivibrionales bacterium]|nr:glutamate racemase [Chitinivibrionales bacterium]MBD3395234.1 glutamate racemase [Chitinivibrionales bacterium]